MEASSASAPPPMNTDGTAILGGRHPSYEGPVGPRRHEHDRTAPAVIVPGAVLAAHCHLGQVPEHREQPGTLR